MGLKASINMATATLIVISILFAYFTWSSKTWIENVDAQLVVQEQRFVEIQPRLTKIEVVDGMHWQDTDRRLTGIEGKLDKVLSVAGVK